MHLSAVGRLGRLAFLCSGFARLAFLVKDMAVFYSLLFHFFVRSKCCSEQWAFSRILVAIYPNKKSRDKRSDRRRNVNVPYPTFSTMRKLIATSSCIALLVFFWTFVQGAESKLRSAIILPHGDFAWDPTLVSNKNERAAADAVATAAREASRWFVQQHFPQGDDHLILISTPHGITVENDFSLLTGSPQAAGSATIGQDLIPPNTNKTYTISIRNVRINQTISNQLYQYLRRHADTQNVTLMNASPDGVSPVPLFWGEVVPLLLLKQQQQQEHLTKTTLHKQSKSHLIWSHPRRRLIEANHMVSELVHMGSRVRRFLDTHYSHLDWSILISGDLAHTHRANGPYGYSRDAAKLDQALETWASGGQFGADLCTNATARNALLQRAPNYQPQGKACAFTGIVFLHGLLCGYDSGRTSDQAWHSRVLINRNVTYYGMMVAEFWPGDDPSPMPRA